MTAGLCLFRTATCTSCNWAALCKPADFNVMWKSGRCSLLSRLSRLCLSMMSRVVWNREVASLQVVLEQCKKASESSNSIKEWTKIMNGYKKDLRQLKGWKGQDKKTLNSLKMRQKHENWPHDPTAAQLNCNGHSSDAHLWREWTTPRTELWNAPTNRKWI